MAKKEDLQKKQKEKHEKDLVAEVVKDYEARRARRLPLERQWELNLNFLSGNQYFGLNRKGELAQEDKEFFWQDRKVFNHIAPIVETRLAKLARVSPSVSVRPRSDDDDDVSNAALAEKLVAGAFKRVGMENVVKKVTAWSETCGSGFYKIVWNNFGGDRLGNFDGKDVYEGEVDIIPVSPFEIFPDNLSAEGVGNLRSIIHAKAIPVDIIKERYNVIVAGEDIDTYERNTTKTVGGAAKNTVKNSAIVIERYEMPSIIYPNGRLVAVSGGKLLYEGELPYLNGDDEKRALPFVKQDCVSSPGKFFGNSIIERLIPIQKAFNAVKNRKHEFLSRLSMGVMTVEDGVIDVDDLEQDGLKPGKVIVYRQGGKAPELMDGFEMPSEFNEEEDKLISEFVTVSGVSDVSSSSENAKANSGVALQILIEQDNERLTMTAENIRRAYVEASKQILHLYRQFIAGVRVVKTTDAFNKTKIYYADKRSCLNDDVYLESENELFYTPAQKKEMIFKLYESGLLADDEGRISTRTKEKVLSLLGYKELDAKKGIARLHEEKAQAENEKLKKQDLAIDEIDDDSIHIDEHIRYVLSEYDDLSATARARYMAHVKAHKERLNEKEED